jgi:hypothetical protein
LIKQELTRRLPEENMARESLARLLALIDEKSRFMLWHLWWHRHAGIPELRDLINASSDFEVLHRLKEIINVHAQRLWGKTAVYFAQSKTDPVTGEKILFSWWFREEDVSLADRGGPLLDVLNEKDGVTVIAQLPTSVDLATADLQLRNGVLKVRLCRRSRKGTEVGSGDGHQR